MLNYSSKKQQKPTNNGKHLGNIDDFAFSYIKVYYQPKTNYLFIQMTFPGSLQHLSYPAH
jgi:hypothetical protein